MFRAMRTCLAVCAVLVAGSLVGCGKPDVTKYMNQGVVELRADSNYKVTLCMKKEEIGGKQIDNDMKAQTRTILVDATTYNTLSPRQRLSEIKDDIASATGLARGITNAIQNGGNVGAVNTDVRYVVEVASKSLALSNFTCVTSGGQTLPCSRGEFDEILDQLRAQGKLIVEATEPTPQGERTVYLVRTAPLTKEDFSTVEPIDRHIVKVDIYNEGLSASAKQDAVSLATKQIRNEKNVHHLMFGVPASVANGSELWPLQDNSTNFTEGSSSRLRSTIVERTTQQDPNLNLVTLRDNGRQVIVPRVR